MLRDFCQRGWSGYWSPSHVQIRDGKDSLVVERHDPRTHFSRLVKQIVWDKLDILYFAGYALWGYATQPFCFLRPGVEAWELPASDVSGARRRRLAVRFPPELPAHSPGQIFHVDDSGLIRRNDYTAQVVGSWAARWSRFGVRTTGCPAQPRLSARYWSSVMNRMFGRWLTSTTLAGRRTVRRPDPAPRPRR